MEEVYGIGIDEAITTFASLSPRNEVSGVSRHVFSCHFYFMLWAFMKCVLTVRAVVRSLRSVCLTARAVVPALL